MVSFWLPALAKRPKKALTAEKKPLTDRAKRFANVFSRSLYRRKVDNHASSPFSTIHKTISCRLSACQTKKKRAKALFSWKNGA
jgi:hypothetical protein